MKSIFNDQTVEITPSGKGFLAELHDQTVSIEILQASDGKVELLLDGKRVTAYISADNNKRWVTLNGQTLVLTKTAGARKGAGSHHHAAGELTAPMPGQVRAVNVKEGQAVTKGQTLLLLEAMKMEIRVQAPREATVKKLLVKQGQTVEREQVLIEIE